MKTASQAMMSFTLASSALLASCAAQANPVETSREYKLLLDPSHFNYATQSTTANSYLTDAKQALSNAISRNVTGSWALTKARQVAFYDTPTSCQLKQLGYILRDRTSDGKSEVTLKFRSPDRFIADFEDLSSPDNQADTKLEADISTDINNGIRIVYSHSTTTPNTRTLNDMADVNSHFSGFADAYGLSNNLTLAKVGGLTINEYVFEGSEIDLGSIDASLELTLWYTSSPTASQQPVIAEVSFKYKDPNGNYTAKVVQRAKLAFDAMTQLSAWNSTSSLTKTAFIYAATPNFCSQ